MEEPIDILRNLFLFVPFLLLVHVTSAVALPKCPGSYNKNTWHNCEGAWAGFCSDNSAGFMTGGVALDSSSN